MPHLTANGISLHHRFDGPSQGSVVMLSNSLASTLAMWDGQIAPLTAAGFRVLRYDHRGHGESEAGEGDYTITQLTDDALALLDALRIDRVHFCGLSLGGFIGQELGARHGDRLLSLTLCDTASQVSPATMWEERIAAVRAGGMAAVVDATLDRWFTQPGQARLPGPVGEVRKMILGTSVAGFCGCAAAIRDMDLGESNRAVATPTLIVVGEHDPATPVEAARGIQSRIRGAGLTVIPAAAHMPNIEQADAFNDTLLGWLEKNS
jgi:3-oxoadipate enol-lactonase